MRSRIVWLLAAVCTLILTTGCGMEALDTRVQARAEVGLDQHPLKVAESKWVCANLVTVNNQKFNVKQANSGEVENIFGPFVACNTPVDPGEGTCSNCGQNYRTSGELNLPSIEEAKRRGKSEQGLDSRKIAVLATPRFVCPHCQVLIAPGALLVREQNKDATLGPNACPGCKKYFTVVESDLVMATEHQEEILCPSCKKPVDPTINLCGNPSCKLADGTPIRLVKDFEGPCWRCGGVRICPNCSGSGIGSTGTYGNTPPDCWYCKESGHCPECDRFGFSRYEGQLPIAYSAFSRPPEPQPLPNSQRKWKYKGSGEKKAKTKE